jgi:hypothetical protein
MRDYLAREFGIYSIWHFTDVKNLLGILEAGGLLPSELLDMNEVTPSGDPTARAREVKLGLHQYVHLCFFPEHPMEWAITHNPSRHPELREVIWLEISTNVLTRKDVCYTYQMANTKNARKLDEEAAIADLNLGFLFPSKSKAHFNQNIMYEKRDVRSVALKHEILVPGKIRLSDIKNFDAQWNKYHGNKISI